ncbi:hypothetical protein ACFPU1_06000 [Thalassorhabdus alkalitolerans]|uniref:Uncharacterized protein n=1 Tax=Thalassorhabdus alkalitolerans TaxID=2282697 RepID=A0ABW0YMG4_9BACI
MHNQIKPMLAEIKTFSELKENGFSCLTHFDKEDNKAHEGSCCWIWTNGSLRIIVEDKKDGRCEIVGEFTENTLQRMIKSQWVEADRHRKTDEKEITEENKGCEKKEVTFFLGGSYNLSVEVEVTPFDDEKVAIDLAKVMLASDLGISIDLICEALNISSYDQKWVKVKTIA